MSKNTLLRKFGSDIRDGTGLILANLDTERTSRNLSAAGGNLLVMGIIYTRGGSGAATTVTVEIDESDDDGTNWYTVQAGATSAGVVTLTDAKYRKAVTTNAQKWSLRVKFGMPLLRIRVTSASGVTGHDQVSITADIWNERG